MSLTENFCKAVLATTSDTLTAAEVAAAHRVVLDGLAVAVAGSRQEGPGILAAHLRDLGGKPTSTAIGFGFKTSLVNAAYLNGASMHVLDFEPMSNPANHATSTTLPGLLALAEAASVAGREVVTALVKGIEVQGRIRAASSDSVEHRFHTPGVVGVMGSAAAAAHLLGLDLTQLRNALGLAGSRAGCLPANSGTMTKATHPGLACAQGLDAALLARRGFTASQDILDDPKGGYAQAFMGQPLDAAVLQGFGVPFRFVDPGFAIKLFPCQYTTHWGINAALDLRPRIPDPQRIQAVQITSPVLPFQNRPFPKTGLDGKFSLQYTVACALLDGAVKIDHFTDARRFQPDMEAFLPRIEVVYDETRPEEAQGRFIDVTVTLKGGEQLHKRCDKPRGHYHLPPIGDEEHLVKVRDCLAQGLAEDDAARVIEMAGNLNDLDTTQVHELLQLLGKPGG